MAAADKDAPSSRSVVSDVGGRVGNTLEASVTSRPGWRELAWDAVLVGGAVVEAVSLPTAIGGAVLNRLIHAAR